MICKLVDSYNVSDAAAPVSIKISIKLKLNKKIKTSFTIESRIIPSEICYLQLSMSPNIAKLKTCLIPNKLY
jgi:hypothetical protein